MGGQKRKNNRRYPLKKTDFSFWDVPFLSPVESDKRNGKWEESRTKSKFEDTSICLNQTELYGELFCLTEN